MEKDPAPPMDASQTPAGEHRVTPGEKKPETQMTESKNDTEEIADPSKATDIFQNYMQSFSNKQIMQTYGQKHLEELVKKREFWDSQPVPKTKELMTGELAQVHGPLEKKTIDDVRKEPYPLPEEFEWGIVELNNLPELDELYDHLYNHYVEDDDGFFRFNYSREFIKWALSPPGYEKDMLISIKDKKTGKMVAFISGVIINLKIEKKSVKATEVNFLCVHKSLRKNRIAPVLIKEVTRRSNLKGVWQGFYTSGQMLPVPIAQARYFHRALDPKKLIDVNFSSLPKTQSLKTHQRIYALEDEIKLKGVRPMQEADVPKVRQLLVDFLSKYDLYEDYSKKEIKHFFMPRDKILSSYVVAEGANIVGLISFYHLPSTILKSEQHKELRAAYSYYIVPGKHTLKEMFEATLILAKNEGFDVYNALDIMDNKQVFEDLFFKPGDGFLQYYMYNWKLHGTHLQPGQIGKVLF